MINPLIHYEVEIATRQHERLQHRVALWHLARQAATEGQRQARPDWLRLVLTAVALVVGSAASANVSGHA